MIGEYGEQIDEAPYLLEDMINSFDRISYNIKVEVSYSHPLSFLLPSLDHLENDEMRIDCKRLTT